MWLLLMSMVLNSKSGSRAVFVETTHEAGRHFFSVYGVLTRHLIFSPEALWLLLSVRETSSEEQRRRKDRNLLDVFKELKSRVILFIFSTGVPTPLEVTIV